MRTGIKIIKITQVLGFYTRNETVSCLVSEICFLFITIIHIHSNCFLLFCCMEVTILQYDVFFFDWEGSGLYMPVSFQGLFF